jgi:hypothetical protein
VRLRHGSKLRALPRCELSIGSPCLAVCTHCDPLCRVVGATLTAGHLSQVLPTVLMGWLDLGGLLLGVAVKYVLIG